MNLSTACKTLLHILDTELSIDTANGEEVAYNTDGLYAEAATYFRFDEEFFTLNVVCASMFVGEEERTYIVVQKYCETGNTNVYTSLGVMYCL